ncbi:MAG: universal stress protein [Haloarculaceae archaeon]
MTKHVLVPVDGSPLSFEALRYALTTFSDASITVLHVIDVFEPGYGAQLDFDTSDEPLMGSEEWYDRAEEVSELLFEEVRAVAEEYDHEVTTESEAGDPSRVIVDYVEDRDVDHVVLGSHGRAEAERTLFGNVADIVVRRATVPVTIIR